jgi:MoaA/NifB/PqqE/SkfB family radical SAM enzyme
MENNELTEYFDRYSKDLVSKVLMRSLRDPKETAFILGFGRSVRKANAIRRRCEEQGLHVPPFLISSITTSCNLFCKGCYARSNGICGNPIRPELSSEDWRSIFMDAKRLGVIFNILAGGEPLMRRDVIMVAREMKDMVFPIFTNGTVIDEGYVDLFDDNRNLIPILSLEGDRDTTDTRRGEGTYDIVVSKMGHLNERGLFFGVSLTITKENMSEVMSDDFIASMRSHGCKIVFYIEFIANEVCSRHLVFDGSHRDEMKNRLSIIRERYRDVLFMSFPGDESGFGGCLGAGRGFLHINPYGDAEACPASPLSDVNVRDSGLEVALKSQLFSKLRTNGVLAGYHEGGCALMEHREEVNAILQGMSK